MTQPKLTLHHLGYVVPKMPNAIRRFVDEGAQVIIESTDDLLQGVSCALLRLPGDTMVELVAPLDPESSPVGSRLKRGGGLDHLCYEVDDLAAALAHEIEQDAIVICEPTYAVTFDKTVAFVQRRTGLVVEFMADAP